MKLQQHRSLWLALVVLAAFVIGLALGRSSGNGPAYQEPGVELTTYSLTLEQQTELERRITERDAHGLIPFLDGILGEDFGGTMFSGTYGFSTLFGDFHVNIETDPNGSKKRIRYEHHFILKGNSLYEVTLANPPLLGIYSEEQDRVLYYVG